MAPCRCITRLTTGIATMRARTGRPGSGCARYLAGLTLSTSQIANCACAKPSCRSTLKKGALSPTFPTSAPKRNAFKKKSWPRWFAGTSSGNGAALVPGKESKSSSWPPDSTSSAKAFGSTGTGPQKKSGAMKKTAKSA